MKGFALGLALKQRRNATLKSSIAEHKNTIIMAKYTLLSDVADTVPVC